MTRRIALIPFFLLSLVACGGKKESTSAPAGSSGVEPISSRGTPAAPSTGAPAAPGKLDFDLPAGWVAEPPKTNMRLAQASIPGPGGVGEMAVFFFGTGDGGGVEANIQRWTDQMAATPGAPKPERGTLESHGLKVSWVDVHGTLKPSSMGMGPSSPVPDARLYGAVVEGPGGPWFFKVTGPDKTLGPQHDPFFSMMKSVRPKAS